MPTEVLTQLRTLRESIAETLRQDPRFLTLTALDKSIAEITGVLTASGLLDAEPPPLSALHFDPPADSATSESAPAAQPQPEPRPRDLSAAAVGAPTYAPASLAPMAANKPKNTSSSVNPAVRAAALAAVGLAAEATHLSHGWPGSADLDADQGQWLSPEADEAGENETLAAGSAGTGVIPNGKASGYVPMAAKPDATQYQPAISVKFGKLPNKVDLRPLMTPIEDQGDTMSCVANAVAGAYEYWIKKASKQDTNVSRLFVYYNARWRDGSQDKDDGSAIQLAMEGLSKFGACTEKVWPFDKRLILKKPGSDAYQDGVAWRVQDMAQVPTTLEAWKQAIAEGKPIVFGIALFDSFDNCSQRGGVVEMPSPDDVAHASHSGHAMCAVGYSDTEKVFIVRNSWGADWGDKGYCYVPYAYILNPKFNDGDNWVFVPKVPMQPPREVWSDDTTPVTNDGRGVDFVIERFRIEDYEHVVFDFFDRVRRPFNTFISQDFSQYVSFASRNMWSAMESFDYRSFLASTVALSSAAVATTAIASEFSGTETPSITEESPESSLLESENESVDEDGEPSEGDESEDEAFDEDETEDTSDGDQPDDDETSEEDEESSSEDDGAEGVDDHGGDDDRHGRLPSTGA